VAATHGVNRLSPNPGSDPHIYYVHMINTKFPRG
jgi:hypothetical protein